MLFNFRLAVDYLAVRDIWEENQAVRAAGSAEDLTLSNKLFRQLPPLFTHWRHGRPPAGAFARLRCLSSGSAAYLHQQRAAIFGNQQKVGGVGLPGGQMVPDVVVIGQRLECSEGAMHFGWHDLGQGIGQDVRHVFIPGGPQAK